MTKENLSRNPMCWMQLEIAGLRYKK